MPSIRFFVLWLTLCAASFATARADFDPGGMTQMDILPLEVRKQNQQPKRMNVAVWPTGLIDAGRTHYLLEGDATIMMIAVANPDHVSVAKAWIVCDLPSGIALAGTNAQLISASVERSVKRRDEHEYTRHRIAVRPAQFTFGDGKFRGHTVYQAPAMWLTTTLPADTRPGKAYIHLEWRAAADGPLEQTDESWVNLAVLPPLISQTPRIASSGLMGRASVSVDDGDDATARCVTSLIKNMGCNYYFDGPQQSVAPEGLKRWTEGRNIWQAMGQFRHNLTNRIGVGNGFMIHMSSADRDTMPADIQFTTRKGERRDRAVAPWALYTGHPWVKQHVLDVIRDDITSGRYESLWANWEPEAGMHYLTNGDFSEGTRRQFIKWSKLSDDEVDRHWPDAIAQTYPDQWRAFRNWELGRWTKIVADTVAKASRSVGGEGRFIPCTVSDYIFADQSREHAINSAVWGDFPYVWQTWTYYDVPLVDERFPVSDRSGASMVVRSGVVARRLDEMFGADRQMTGGCVYGWDQGSWELRGRNGYFLPEQVGFLHLSTVMAGLHVAGNYGEWPIFDARYAHALARANQRIARWEAFTLEGRKQRKHVVIPTSPYPQVTPPHVKPEDQHVTPWENPNYLFSYEYVRGDDRLIAIANTWDFGECFVRLRIFDLDTAQKYTLTEPEAARLFTDEQGNAALTAGQLEDGVLVHIGAMRWGAFLLEPFTGTIPEHAATYAPGDIRTAQRAHADNLLLTFEAADRTWGTARRARSNRDLITTIAQDASKRFAVVPVALSAPQIDGVDDDTCWQSAVEHGEFATARDRLPTRYATTWRAVHREGMLYLFVDCAQDMTAPVVEASERDGRVWRDDSIEIMVNRIQPRSAQDFTHVMLNAAGTLYDAATGRSSWNGIEHHAVRVRDGGWSAELAIPLSDEVVLPTDCALRFNLVRNVQETSTNAAEASTWYPVWSANADMRARGVMVLQ